MGKTIRVLVVVLIILVLTAIGLFWAKESGFLAKMPSQSKNNNDQVTKEQKAQILNSLKQEVVPATLATEAQKAQILNSLKQETTKAPAITDEQKAKILESLK